MYRELEVFDRGSEELVAAYRLHDIGIDTMQRLWKRPPDDPMAVDYAVEAGMMETLRRYLDTDVEFDDEKYIYQIGTYRDYPGEVAEVESQPRG